MQIYYIHNNKIENKNTTRQFSSNFQSKIPKW